MPTNTEAVEIPKGAASRPLEKRLEIYRVMFEARSFEERAYKAFIDGLVRLVKGTSHLAIGQEAVAARFAAAMNPDDLTFCTYRGHTHTLLRGAPPVGLMAELMGRANGVCGGKGGSMHLTHVPSGAMGSYAIVGAHLSVANRAAWAAQKRGTGQIVTCFCGAGATNIGAFHEALNLAAVWMLPIVFVCENNQYMEYTPIESVTSGTRPAPDRALAYGLPSIAVDGNDAGVTYETAVQAMALARSGGGPSLIEAITYRHGEHSRADPGAYRPADDVPEWRFRDPIPTYRNRLTRIGASEPQIVAIEEAVEIAMDRAMEEAKAGPRPSVTTVGTNLWADGGSAWRR